MAKKKKEETEEKISHSLSGDIKRSVVAIFLFCLALIVFLGFFAKAGMFGNFLDLSVSLAIGWVKFVFPVFLIIAGVVLLLRKETLFYVAKLIGLFTVLMSVSGFFHWFFAPENMLRAAKQGDGGGYVGYILNYFFAKFFGRVGSLAVILTVLLAGIIIAFNFSMMHLWGKIREMLGKKESDEKQEKEPEDEEEISDQENKENLEENSEKIKEKISGKANEDKALEEEAEKNIGRMEFVDGRDQFFSSHMESPEDERDPFKEDEMEEDKSLDLKKPTGKKSASRSKKWVFPTINLLEGNSQEAKGGDVENNFAIIEKTLKDFRIEVERGGVQVGPSVTQYSFRPAVGVKISKILALQNDLSLALAASPIRIEAPIPGKSLIGVEVPNKVSAEVRLRDILKESAFRRRTSDLTLALGREVSGDCVLGDLAKMPHLLIAGATGTGKSVCINAIITTLLYQNSAENLKFLMVDPKRVELSIYSGIPHLLTDVIVENDKVINALKWAVGEMSDRYKILQKTGSRDIGSYRDKMEDARRRKTEGWKNWKEIPYIVIVIDELADLMSSHGREVEAAIVRIAQMARAVGIHLILSTQRPSVEVITGLIKANITTRIAFQVATQIDSRTIIDMGGADKLLGKGDMLYLSASSPKPKRIQGVFVSEMEVKRVVDFIKENNPKIEEKEREEDEEEGEITESRQKGREILEYSGAEDSPDAHLLKKAKAEIVRYKKASASFLQRRLRIGYNRASRILEELEEEGVVGPQNGSKPREIYLPSQGEEELRYEDAKEDQEKRDKWQL